METETDQTGNPAHPSLPSSTAIHMEQEEEEEGKDDDERENDEGENGPGPNLLTRLVQEGADQLNSIYHRTNTISLIIDY